MNSSRRCLLHTPLLMAALVAMMLFATRPAAGATVAVVFDGPTQRPDTLTPLIRQEVSNLLGSEFEVDFPADKQLVADWTPEGVYRTLQRSLTDPQIDVVIALGLIGSNAAARIERLPKPVIATVVPDARLQGFPLRDGGSGRLGAPCFVWGSD